jgi:phosphoenolpyruvate-protein kinase (PTS system EI component)
MNKNINEYIDDLFDKIKPVVSFWDKNTIKLSVCGQLAGVKDVALRFYKIGIKNLSVSPSLIQLLNLCYEEYIKGSHN